MNDWLPSIPVGQWFSDVVYWSRDNLDVLLGTIRDVLDTTITELSELLIAVPSLLMVLVMAGLAWLVRSWQFALFSVVGLLLVQAMPATDLWAQMLRTLSLVAVASAIAMLIALPLGILAARNEAVSQVVRPVLDLMQTMPAFVYLIPAIFFFSVGVAPGAVATIIFSMPPGVRLTELGIRQVDKEVVEAGHAFGAPPLQILRRVQIPLAMPTIMAGVNQVIMLSLSMVVIAGMVGADGLGEDVYRGITRVDLSLGFESGLAVVILAIYLDRLTSALANKRPQGARTRLRLRARRPANA